MAARPTYLIRESLSNLRRNVLMSVTAIITIVVSLSIVGASLLLRQGMNNYARQFRDKIELNIWMKPEATEAQIDAVKAELEDLKKNRQIVKYIYVDKKDSFSEFKDMFRNDPEQVGLFTDEKELPTSFRVVPSKAERISSLGEPFRNREGVFRVVSDEDIKTLLRYTRIIQVVLLTIAISLLVAAVLLILNTIQLAIFSRRREVAVMKLVGGTNWFIRLPFMLEGLLQGFIGAVIAFALVYLGAGRLQNAISNSSTSLFKSFSVSSSQIAGTGILMLLVGAAVGAIGSAIAVSRFLDV
jgi:cell division transport system permease protein